MQFRSRNALYLQISANDVLPLYLFLDDRHVDWMSDRIMQHILADLRPKILPKMKAEVQGLFNPNSSSSGKQGTVDVHRGDTYQFAFFFRKTEPHAVLVKTRTFATAPPSAHATPSSSEPSISRRHVGKRKGREASDARKKHKAEVNSSAPDGEEWLVPRDCDTVALENAQGSLVAIRHRTHSKGLIANNYCAEDDLDGIIDVDKDLPENLDDGPGLASPVKVEAQEVTIEPSHENDGQLSQQVHFAIEDEEDKPKPLMRLKYKGFNIHGYCLCVVAEPWPRIRYDTRAQSAAPEALDRSSRASNEGGANHADQLFWPELDVQEETPTYAERRPERVLLPVTLFTQGGSENGSSEGNDELVVFSQALNSGGNFQPGLENDDEMDGAAFFGDADEAREF